MCKEQDYFRQLICMITCLPAYNDELSLRSQWSEAGPDVHGEQSAAAVKDRGQRGHESSQHHSQHQASQTWTQEVKGDQICEVECAF